MNVQIVVAPPIPTDGTASSLLDAQDDPNFSGIDGTTGNLGHGRRRGIFNIPFPTLELPRLAPATINIQIPGKLPFNPLNIFNVQTLKNFVQSVTEKFMRNNSDQPYKTGFGDSVTIISEDPDHPVSEPYNNNDALSDKNENDISPQKQDRVGLIGTDVPTKEFRAQEFNRKPEESTTRRMGSDDLHLSEESVIDRQVATLNEVLSNEMNPEKLQAGPTSPSPPLISFLPDFSALSQLFNWGEHSVRSLAVCNACKVAFGLFVSQVSTLFGSILFVLFQLTEASSIT